VKGSATRKSADQENDDIMLLDTNSPQSESTPPLEQDRDNNTQECDEAGYTQNDDNTIEPKKQIEPERNNNPQEESEGNKCHRK
jgi:hypothetical protein